MEKNIPFNKPCLEGKEIENILEAIRGGKIAGDGVFTRRCQDTICDILSAEKALLTTSCTDALELAALLYDFKPGDEFILPSFTFVSTATAFCLRGSTPVFVEIRPDTLNIDETRIEEAVTPRTKGIIPVHYAGVACEMDAINDIARRHNLRVIEDAAQGFLGTYGGVHLGTLGDAGCFSFHETKTFMSGEGGAIVLNREEDMEKAEILREKGANRAAFFRGQVDKYTWVGLGSSFLPSDIIAAFLLGQLEVREEIIGKRRRIHRNYDELLAPVVERGEIKTIEIPDHCTVNYHMYYLLAKDLETRTSLLDYLDASGVCAVFHCTKPLRGSF